MAQQTVPASPAYRYAHYTDLKGIDLTADVTLTPRNRAADLLNMLPDVDTGNPRKRRGWRKLYDFGSSENFLGSKHIIKWNVDLIITTHKICVHECGDDWDNAHVKVLQTDNTNTCTAVGFIGWANDDTYDQYQFIAHHKRYKLTHPSAMYYAIALTDSIDNYIPTTVISRDPNGTNGYAYEPVNAFTPKRYVQFLGNTSDEDYYIYPAADRANHVVVDITSVKVRDANGEWQSVGFTKTSSGGNPITAYTDQTRGNTSSYSTYIGFKLNNPSGDPVVTGQDNVRAEIIEFSPNKISGVYYGYWSPIEEGIINNGVCACYGMTSMDRAFFAVDDGLIYYSDPDRFNYLPDNNFIQLTGDAPIMGFHRKNTYLVAITQDSTDYTVYMITGAIRTITHTVINENGVTEQSTEEMTYFMAKTALAGTGAVAKKSFSTLVDDTLFLAKQGIYGITSNTVTSETVLANRSELINPRLISEPNLDRAVSCVWKGMYVLAVNNHVYVIDSRETHNNRGVSYGYECYYWDNVPAEDFLTYNGDLFFGDYDGNWCMFNTDVDNVTAYEDDGVMDEHGNMTGGDPIHAFYKLRLDSDGYPQYLKTLNKRGTSIELMQLSNSGVKVSYSKDGNTPVLIADLQIANRFVWTLVDFENFSFDSASNVRTFYPKKKMKKYKYLQFILESDEIDQNFGINGITKTYYIGNFAKR